MGQSLEIDQDGCEDVLGKVKMGNAVILTATPGRQRRERRHPDSNAGNAVILTATPGTPSS